MGYTRIDEGKRLIFSKKRLFYGGKELMIVQKSTFILEKGEKSTEREIFKR